MALILLLLFVLVLLMFARLLEIAAPLLVAIILFFALGQLLEEGCSPPVAERQPSHLYWDATRSDNVSIENMCRQESQIIIHDLLTSYYDRLSSKSRSRLTHQFHALDDILWLSRESDYLDPSHSKSFDSFNPHWEILDELHDKEALKVLPRQKFETKVSTVIKHEREQFIKECVKPRH